MLKVYISVHEYGPSSSTFVTMVDWFYHNDNWHADGELIRHREDGPAQTIYGFWQNKVIHSLFWKNVLISNISNKGET